MSQILKTEAIVLKKMDYRESSKIAVLLTKYQGKISVLIKGARSSKSQIGPKIDLLNHVQAVIYFKELRELQILTQAELLQHHPKIKEDIDKLKYAYAVLEIIDELTLEGESNEKLFRGTVKILTMMNDSQTDSAVLLIKFILFVMKESGYELVLSNCNICNKELSGDTGFFNAEKGITCKSCIEGYNQSYNFSQELFNLLLSLNEKNAIRNISSKDLNRALNFLEQYMKYHIPEFKGIRSIHLY